jgi:hypothetical protein
MTVEVELPLQKVENLRRVAEQTGKADWDMSLEIHDSHDIVCCLLHGTWQMRRASADGPAGIHS